MNAVTDAVRAIDWGQPQYLLAAAAVLVAYLAGGRKRRKTTSHRVSSLAAGAGFVLSGWAGLLTVAMAVSYRVFQSVTGPKQAWFTWLGGLAGFTSAAWAVHAIDPKAGREASRGRLGGLLGSLYDFASLLAARPLLSLAVVAGISGLTWWARKQRKTAGYKDVLSPDRMYNGIRNPTLKTLPEQQRDPQRTFSVKMRQEQLKEQRGICAYQNRVSGHPKWEPYRSGVQWEGDHIVPHAAGGATNQANLQVLCADCNSGKGDKGGQHALRAVEARWRGKS